MDIRTKHTASILGVIFFSALALGSAKKPAKAPYTWRYDPYRAGVYGQVVQTALLIGPGDVEDVAKAEAKQVGTFSIEGDTIAAQKELVRLAAVRGGTHVLLVKHGARSETHVTAEGQNNAAKENFASQLQCNNGNTWACFHHAGAAPETTRVGEAEYIVLRVEPSRLPELPTTLQMTTLQAK